MQLLTLVLYGFIAFGVVHILKHPETHYSFLNVCVFSQSSDQKFDGRNW